MDIKDNEEPFVYLLNTVRGFYLYEVNRNEIIQISENVYNILNEKKYIEHKNDKEIRELTQKGYLQVNYVTEIIHPETENVEYYVQRKLGQLILQVTQGCNLKCSYCVFANESSRAFRNHSNVNMTWDIAKTAIDYYFEHSIDSIEHTIAFYGGEPLLAFDLIKKIILYVEEEYRVYPVNYSLTTNGTILNDDIIKFFSKYKVDIMVSLDGPQKIHDTNRRFSSDGSGSYKKIMKNLELFKQIDEEYYSSIHFNTVINPYNDYSKIKSGMIENRLFNLENTNISIIDDRGLSMNVEYSDNYIKEYYYSMFLVFLERYNLISFSEQQESVMQEFSEYDSFCNIILKKADSLKKKDAPSGPCVPGKQRVFVSYDGECYPCEKVSELSSFLNIGNVFDGLDVDRIKRLLNIASNNEKKCKRCWAFRMCNHCVVHYDNNGKISPVLNAKSCYETLSDLENKLRTAILKKELLTFYQKNEM